MPQDIYRSVPKLSEVPEVLQPTIQKLAENKLATINVFQTGTKTFMIIIKYNQLLYQSKHLTDSITSFDALLFKLTQLVYTTDNDQAIFYIEQK